MKMSKVGNQTNSQDPQAVNSRVFVGNLNTFQCSKTDVERMFQRYGRLAGISMHKGFAFIQFTNPLDARSACLGEDGRTVLGQTLDVNLVCEPKPHQIGRKRQNLSKTGNDWDYFYDSYYSSAFPTLEMVTATPSASAKRARLMITAPTRPQLATIIPMKSRRKQSPSSSSNNNNNLQHQHQHQQQNNGNNHLIRQQHYAPAQLQLQQQQQQTSYQPQQTQQHQDQTIVISQLKTYSNPDILICGNCREMFGELADMVQHKKTYCKFRFTCKCNVMCSDNSKNINSINNNNNNDRMAALLCVQCKESFNSAWDLIVHAQAVHMINVYELALQNSGGKNASPNFSSGHNGLEQNQLENDKKDMTDDSSDETTISNQSYKMASQEDISLRE